MKSLSHLGILMSLLVGFAHAQESKPLIVGPGLVSCAKFSALPALEVAEVTAWAQGFVSGMNSYRWLNTHYQPLVLPDAVAIQARLTTFCVEHPDDTALKGTLVLFKELEG